MTKKEYSVEFAADAFAEGACKIAFRGWLVGDGQRNGEHIIVKAMKAGAFDTRRLWVPEQSVTETAKELGHAYNKELSKLKVQKIVSFCTPIVTKVRFSFPLWELWKLACRML